MKTILSRTTIVVVTIALLLAIFSCGKDKDLPAPYVKLQTGLQNVGETYLIDGVTKITWKVPTEDQNTRITVSIGDAQLMGQQPMASGTQSAQLVLTTTTTHARFTANKADVKQVEIISIE